MYNVSFRIVNDRFEAEDIMQEAFLKAFQNLTSYKGNVSFGAWLKKIVVNKSLDYLRSRRHKESFFDTIDEMEIEDEVAIDDSPDSYKVEDLKNVREKIEELPEGYRIILTLYLLEGYDHEEIAEITGISPSTSRSQYSRAKKTLIQNLKKKKK